ncbi:serine hydrolase [Poseidonocella sp. HB161398]|uniref:serine hydrolase domain-containing protein n=1 Tax=Poseidonocella sp. HB161398 TaxID=2320855 RepID=UPI001107F3A8|nr:serine hydrolase domain-containing protein [Poseidonocella sp. HB161398]
MIHACRITAAGIRQEGDPQALFPWWSFTKTVIALSALRLAEAGALDLDAALPGRDFTLRQLLANRSGLADYPGLAAYRRAVEADGTPWPEDELLARVLALGPLFAPGAGWAYSNTGYMLARQAVEAAAGLSFAALVAETLARPLGLASLRLAETRADFGAILWPEARRYHPGWVYHGCLVGTAGDAAHLLEALVRGRLLPPARVAEMARMHRLGGALPGRPWTEHGYGLGMMTGQAGAAGRAFGHSGGGPFSTNAVYHYPEASPPATVAVFVHGTEEGLAEREAARLALAP